MADRLDGILRRARAERVPIQANLTGMVLMPDKELGTACVADEGQGSKRQQAAALHQQIKALEAKLARLTAAEKLPVAERAHRQQNRLTNQKLKTLKKPGFYADGGNLYLDFKEPPSKNWVVRYKRGGRARDHGLGAWPLVSLAEARELRDDCLRKLRAGVDPIDEKKARRLQARLERATAMTFRQCAEAYIRAHENSWKSAKHAAQWPATLSTYAYPIFGGLPVAVVDIRLVMKVLQPIWTTKTETASRLRGRIESVLDWATTSGYRQGENPARWKGHLENLLPAKAKVAPVQNFAAIAYTDLPGFMAELAKTGSIGVLALRFAILTATRTGEVIGARWDEIDLDNKLWTIPAARMKAGKEHRVPLSEAAVAILGLLKKLPASPFLFPADHPSRHVSHSVMLMALRRLGHDGITVHGFRSCFSDWCAERTHFPSEVREMALAHSVGNRVEQAYRRGDMFAKRRQLMEAWAKFATTPAPEGAVVSLSRATRLT